MDKSFSESIACSASASVAISTHPKRRDSPETLSVTSRTPRTSPARVKNSHKSSRVIELAIPSKYTLAIRSEWFRGASPNSVNMSGGLAPALSHLPAAATTTITGGAVFARFGFVYLEVTAHELGAVQGGDCLRGLFVVSHFDKSKALGLAGKLVADYGDAVDGADAGK